MSSEFLEGPEVTLLRAKSAENYAKEKYDIFGNGLSDKKAEDRWNTNDKTAHERDSRGWVIIPEGSVVKLGDRVHETTRALAVEMKKTENGLGLATMPDGEGIAFRVDSSLTLENEK